LKMARKESTSAADFLPERRSVSALREAARQCRGCPLYQNATQVVFSEGPASASLMVVGEVPGDVEDLAGRPFVGAAGKLLDEILEECRIERRKVYLTNAVKHFKWVPRGKRRLHSKPGWKEMTACKPWLAAEIEAVRPHTIVCLGASAAQTLLGKQFRVTVDRGKLMESPWAPWTLATFHPSAVLRAPDSEARSALRHTLVQDMLKAVESLPHR
jgi:DNA polymerase